MSRILKSRQINVGDPYQFKNVQIKSVFGNANKNINLTQNNNEKNDREDNQEEFQEQEHIGQDLNEDVIMEAESKSKELLESAQKESVEILNNANAKADEIRIKIEKETKEAKELAYQEGYGDGKLEYEELLAEAKDLKSRAEKEYKSILKSSEAEIIYLVINIAKKVISEELELNENRILYLLKDTLSESSNLDKIVIKVSPYDYDFLDKNRELIASTIEDIGDFEIKKVESLKKGACLVETPSGNIDASIETKFQKIQASFYGILQSRGSEDES